MLQQLDKSLWINEVPFKLIGINFGNRMTCIKLSDGSIWLHSPTKFEESTFKALGSIGNIRYLITPSLMHNLFVMDWKEKSEASQLLAPEKTKKVQSDIQLNENNAESITTMFNGEISCIPIKGMPVLQEYAFIHHASKTLILTDLAFNFGKAVKGWAKLFIKLYGAYDKFGPTLTIRALIKNKDAFRESLNSILQHDFERIIVSHGNTINANGKEILKQAFSKYL